MSALTTIALRLTAAAALACGAGVAGATVVTGTFGSNGTGTFDFHVAGGTSQVDLAYTGGFGDPTFSLFDGAGLHLITNDDSNGLYSHITADLDAGNYTLLVSYCCQVFDYVYPAGGQSASTDGFNRGSYVVGGAGTLAGMQQFMDVNGYRGYAGMNYALNMTGATPGALRADVPEPQSWALVGVAMVGLGISRRRGRG